jgi:hypothetical protein
VLTFESTRSPSPTQHSHQTKNSITSVYTPPQISLPVFELPPKRKTAGTNYFNLSPPLFVRYARNAKAQVAEMYNTDSENATRSLFPSSLIGKEPGRNAPKHRQIAAARMPPCNE